MSELTASPAWKALAAHAEEARHFSIVDLQADAGHARRMTIAVDDAEFDFTNHLVSARTIGLLCDLARQQDVAGWARRMMDGDTVNITENRPAWHTALRAPDAPAQVREALARIRALSDMVRADKNIRDVIHIGIGGSDLGPRLVCEALQAYADGPRMHFVSNVDPDDLDPLLAKLDPAHCLVTVASKTFTTQETALNMKAAQAWLGPRADTLIGMTANPAAARSAGVSADRILPLWDWVGGRFSVWSAVGFPIAVACGFDVFEAFLGGAHAADKHMAEAPYERNAPVLMALFSVWYRNFMGGHAQAVMPYSQPLAGLPAYLQQLEMESNGKRVDRQGRTCAYSTAPVIFGQPGTNAQHAFIQMLHQGTDLIPCDFIGFTEPAGDKARHTVLMANMQAQARALAEGRGGEAARACPGNRPSSTVMLKRLDARNLGLLMAIYEHKTAACGFLWNINSFDQYGVELGKDLAKELLARY